MTEAYGQLNRFLRAATNTHIKDIAIGEVEHAKRKLAANDLLLIRDDIEHFERIGFHQAKIEADIDHEQLRANRAFRVERVGIAGKGFTAN